MRISIVYVAACALLWSAPTLAQPDQESGIPDVEVEESGSETTSDSDMSGDSGSDEGFFTPAQKETWAYPTPYTARPLTMQGRMLRGTWRLNFQDAGPDTGVSMDLGAAYAINDDLEVGISSYRFASSTPAFAQGLLPIIFSPNGDFGDMPLWGRYKWLDREKFEAAADVVFILPTGPGNDFGMTFGVPFRYNGLDNLAIDLGAEFTFRLTDPDTSFALLIPAKLTFNITDEIFVHGATGIGFGRLGGFSDVGVFSPLSFGGGYTLMIKNKIMMDIMGEFGFNPLFDTGRPGDSVDLGSTWFFALGVNVYTEPLGKN